VLERVKATPINSTFGFLWIEVVGPTGGFKAKGGKFLMDWTHVDESALSEIKAPLEKTLVGLDPEVLENYPAEIERLQQLAK
jgi:hypothetical protein